MINYSVNHRFSLAFFIAIVFAVEIAKRMKRHGLKLNVIDVIGECDINEINNMRAAAI